MLTQKDLDKIKILIDERLEEKFEEKLKAFVTKDEFYLVMDKVMKKLNIIEENTAGIGFRVQEHEERITTLEKIHPDGKHPS